MFDFLVSIKDWFVFEFNRCIIREDRWLGILKGLGITVEITFFAIVIGTVLGALLAMMKISKFKPINLIASMYINIIRGTPLVVQLLLIYFGVFGTVDINKIIVAIIAFGLNSGAYIAEIFRAGILAVDKGQMEAGRSLGLNYAETMFKIIMPQAVKNILPTYASEFIVLIKETAIVGYIAIEDLAKFGDIIRSRTYSPFFPMLTTAVIYLLLTSILAKLFSMLERRLRIGDNR